MDARAIEEKCLYSSKNLPVSRWRISFAANQEKENLASASTARFAFNCFDDHFFLRKVLLEIISRSGLLVPR